MASSTDIKFRLLGDASGAIRAFGQAGDAGEKASGRLRDAFSGLGGVLGAVSFGAVATQAFGLAQDLGQLETKSATVFGDSLGDVNEWADTVKRRFGASRSEVVGMATSMADLLKPMGMTAEQAAAMSTETIGLAGALADWSQGQYNAAEVSDILAKAMLGERDQLKALGISISQAEVDERALAIARAEGREEITQMDQALATQQLIFEKSEDAQAAYAEGGNKLVNAQNAIKSVLKDVRDWLVLKLVPAFEGLIDVGSGVIAWARENKDILLAVGAAIAVVAGAQGIIMLVNGLKMARAAMFGLNAVMALNPMLLVAAAVAALVAGLVIAYNRSETFRNIVQDVWAWLQQLWQAITDVAAVIWDGLKAAFDKIKPILAAHLDALKGIIDFIKSVFTGDWKGAWEAVKNIAGAVFDGIKEGFRLLGEGLLELVKATGEALAGAGPVLWGWIVAGFKALPRLVFAGWIGFHTWLWERVGDTASFLASTGSKLWDWIVAGFKALPALIKNAVSGFGSVLWDAGVALVQGLIDGIGSMAGKITDKLTSIVPGGKTTLKAISPVGWFPGLADGGVAQPNSPFLAMLGDNTREPEIVSPVSTMQGAMADVLARSGGYGMMPPIVLELDGRVLGEITVDLLAREGRLRGDPSLVGGLS